MILGALQAVDEPVDDQDSIEAVRKANEELIAAIMSRADLMQMHIS